MLFADLNNETSLTPVPLPRKKKNKKQPSPLPERIVDDIRLEKSLDVFSSDTASGSIERNEDFDNNIELGQNWTNQATKSKKEEERELLQHNTNTLISSSYNENIIDSIIGLINEPGRNSTTISQENSKDSKIHETSATFPDKEGNDDWLNSLLLVDENTPNINNVSGSFIIADRVSTSQTHTDKVSNNFSNSDTTTGVWGYGGAMNFVNQIDDTFKLIESACDDNLSHHNTLETIWSANFSSKHRNCGGAHEKDIAENNLGDFDSNTLMCLANNDPTVASDAEGTEVDSSSNDYFLSNSNAGHTIEDIKDSTTDSVASMIGDQPTSYNANEADYIPNVNFPFLPPGSPCPHDLNFDDFDPVFPEDSDNLKSELVEGVYSEKILKIDNSVPKTKDNEEIIDIRWSKRDNNKMGEEKLNISPNHPQINLNVEESLINNLDRESRNKNNGNDDIDIVDGNCRSLLNTVVESCYKIEDKWQESEIFKSKDLVFTCENINTEHMGEKCEVLGDGNCDGSLKEIKLNSSPKIVQLHRKSSAGNDALSGVTLGGDHFFRKEDFFTGTLLVNDNNFIRVKSESAPDSGVYLSDNSKKSPERLNFQNQENTSFETPFASSPFHEALDNFEAETVNFFRNKVFSQSNHLTKSEQSMIGFDLSHYLQAFLEDQTSHGDREEDEKEIQREKGGENHIKHDKRLVNSYFVDDNQRKLEDEHIEGNSEKITTHNETLKDLVRINEDHQSMIGWKKVTTCDQIKELKPDSYSDSLVVNPEKDSESSFEHTQGEDRRALDINGVGISIISRTPIESPIEYVDNNADSTVVGRQSKKDCILTGKTSFDTCQSSVMNLEDIILDSASNKVKSLINFFESIVKSTEITYGVNRNTIIIELEKNERNNSNIAKSSCDYTISSYEQQRNKVHELSDIDTSTLLLHDNRAVTLTQQIHNEIMRNRGGRKQKKSNFEVQEKCNRQTQNIDLSVHYSSAKIGKPVQNTNTINQNEDDNVNVSQQNTIQSDKQVKQTDGNQDYNTYYCSGEDTIQSHNEKENMEDCRSLKNDSVLENRNEINEDSINYSHCITANIVYQGDEILGKAGDGSSFSDKSVEENNYSTLDGAQGCNMETDRSQCNETREDSEEQMGFADGSEMGLIDKNGTCFRNNIEDMEENFLDQVKHTIKTYNINSCSIKLESESYQVNMKNDEITMNDIVESINNIDTNMYRTPENSNYTSKKVVEDVLRNSSITSNSINFTFSNSTPYPQLLEKNFQDSATFSNDLFFERIDNFFQDTENSEIVQTDSGDCTRDPSGMACVGEKSTNVSESSVLIDDDVDELEDDLDDAAEESDECCKQIEEHLTELDQDQDLDLIFQGELKVGFNSEREHNILSPELDRINEESESIVQEEKEKSRLIEVTLEKMWGTIGINIEVVQSQEEEEEGERSDVIIKELMPGGAAETNGIIRKGDRLVSVNGQVVVNGDSARQLLDAAGEHVQLQLLRHGLHYKSLPGCRLSSHKKQRPTVAAFSPEDQMGSNLSRSKGLTGRRSQSSGNLCNGKSLPPVVGRFFSPCGRESVRPHDRYKLCGSLPNHLDAQDVYVQNEPITDDRLVVACAPDNNNEPLKTVAGDLQMRLGAVPDLDQGYGSGKSPDRSRLPLLTPENTFTVCLVKGSQGLGLSVAGGREEGGGPSRCEGGWPPGLVRIKRLFPNQPAWQCGRLRQGDILLSVNKVPLTGLTNYEALEILRTTPSDVELTVCRPPSEALQQLVGGHLGGGDPLHPPSAPCHPHGVILVISVSRSNSHRTLTLRILRLEFDVVMTKVNGSLGFTLRKEDESVLGHYVRALVREPALSDGRIRPGDKIVAVNEVDMSQMTHEEAVLFLRQCGEEVRLRLYRDRVQTPVSALSPVPRATNKPILRTGPRTGFIVDLMRGVALQEFDVVMTKVNGSLGFTLRKEDESVLGHYVRALVREPALSDGRIRPGDKIVAVNEVDMSQMTHEEAVLFLRQCGEEVRLRLYRDRVQTPVSALSPVPRATNKPILRKEAQDMLSDLAVKKWQSQSPGDSISSGEATLGRTASPRKRRLIKTPSPDSCLANGLIKGDRLSLVGEKLQRPDTLNLTGSINLHFQKPGVLDNPCDLVQAEPLSMPPLSEPVSMPPMLDSAPGEAFSYRNPAYRSANPVSSSKPSTKSQMSEDMGGSRFSEQDLADCKGGGGGDQGGGGGGSKGLLKWKGVVFSPEEEGRGGAAADEGDSSKLPDQSISQIVSETDDTVSSNQVLVVELNRGWNSRLGFSLQSAGSHHTAISAIYPDSVASRDGRLRPGDQLIMVNDESVEGMSTTEVIDLLRKIRGSICITVWRKPSSAVTSTQTSD
ncbi:uncharacterized protein LOC111049444 [Nilaparvata lugens]|uniref:uncharacterized protein LOC111049444 n=1 Tax=Nilaparvata lugens TaxID=108931 RepID=UPI00193CC8F8|nr:uncharacterized protein LOC111049444 [Nilaparvata lugens]